MKKVNKYLFHCSLCGGTDFATLGFAGGFSSRTTSRICRKCGLVCLNPRWDEAGYAEYYRNAYYRAYHFLEKVTPQTDQRGEAIAKGTSQVVGQTASILEIGAGFGTNLMSLCQHGYRNLACIEVDANCCRVIKEHIPSCRVFAGTLAEYVSAEREKSDVVILSHVLEHFVEPRAALMQVRKLLKPEGLLMILVPDAGPPHRLLRQLTTPHTHYFTRVTLSLIVRSCGFEEPTEAAPRPGEIFFVCRRSDHGTEPPVVAAEFPQQIRRARKEWLTEWPNQLGRRVVEIVFSERLASAMWRKVSRLRNNLALRFGQLIKHKNQ